jgi:signal transduction histidine kinase
MLATLCGPGCLWAQEVNKRHVVILLPFAANVVTGKGAFDTAIEAGSRDGSVLYYREYLDADHLKNDARGEASLVQILRSKYAGHLPDVVLADGFDSLAFALKYATEIFGDTPVVFVSVEGSRIEGLQLPPRFTGVTHSDDVRGTLEVALRLHPGTSEVAVIAGTSEFDRYWLNRDRAIFDHMAGQVRFRYLTDLAASELLREVIHLPPHTILFVSSFSLDRTGQDFRDDEIPSLISRKANAPLYGLSASDGYVGGRPSGKEDGRFAAAIGIVRRILSGEKPSNIPIQQSRSKYPYVFDALQLRRWNVDLRLVPPGSLLLNQEPSFWELHRNLVLLVSSFVGLESLLIAILLIQRARRRHAEALLADRNAQLKESERSLRQLSGQLITAYEDERKRIARELHDDLNQRVADLGLSMSNMKRGVPAAMENLRREISSVQERLLSLSDGIRHLSHELHPGMLELFGLVAALRSHCAEFSAVTSLPALFETNCEEPVPPEIGLCLYRIAQESLRNAARHARATRVRVSLMQSGNRLQLVVADDGAGFDEREARSRGGLGLRSMEERAWIVNGTVELASREGSGTTVTVTIELSRPSGQATPPRALARKAG